MIAPKAMGTALVEPLVSGLAQIANIPTPVSRIVNVSVNGGYQGHAILQDDLNEEFLQRIGKVEGSIFGTDLETTDGSWLNQMDGYSKPSAWLTDFASKAVDLDGREIKNLADHVYSGTNEEFKEFAEKYFDNSAFTDFLAFTSVMGLTFRGSGDGGANVRFLYDPIKAKYSSILEDLIGIKYAGVLHVSLDQVTQRWIQIPEFNHNLMQRIWFYQKNLF